MPAESNSHLTPADGLPAAKLIGRGRFLDTYHVYHDPAHPERRWEYVRRPSGKNGVTLVATTKDDRILLVDQFRWPLRAHVLELPAGMLDAGESATRLAAGRELQEETGATFGAVTPLASGPLLPGITDEINEFWHIEVLTYPPFIAGSERLDVRAGNVEEGESIRGVYAVPIAKVPEWLEVQRQSGAIIDLRTYAGLFLLKRRGHSSPSK